MDDRATQDTYRVVRLHLGKVRHVLRLETPREVARAVSGAALDALPVLDLGEDEVDALVDELVGGVAVDRRLDTRLLAGLHAPLDDARLDLGDLGDGARDGLHHGARDDEVVGVLDGLGHVRHNRDRLDLRDVAEVDVLLYRAQDGRATGASPRSVLVVRRRAIPTSQTLRRFSLDRPGRLVGVGQGHDVGGDRGLVCLLEAGQVVRPGDEVSRDGIG